MAEVVLGDIVAKLRVDNTQFEQALNQAQQRLGQFNQTTQQTTQAQRTAAQTLLQEQRAAAQAALQAQRAADQAALQDKRASQQAALQAQRAANQAILQDQRATYQTQLQAQRAAAQQMLQVQREAAAQARAAQQEASTGGGFLSGALQIAGGIGIATGISSLISQMKELAVSVVDVGTRMQSLRASFSALGGGATAGLENFTRLTEMAQSLGVAFDPLARGFRSITAAATQAGLPLADQLRLLQALAVEARRVGASNEELGRLLTGVSQVFGKGVLSMEEMRQQIGEALPTALTALAKGLGITTQELTKLIETGTLEAVPWAKAFTRGLEEVQAASGKMGDGARQAFNRLGNSILALKDAIAGSGLLTFLGAAAEKIQLVTDKLTGLVKAMGGGGGAAETAPGLTPQQQTQLDTFNRLIRSEEAQPRNAPEYLARLKEQRDILVDLAKAKQAEADAQAQSNAEAVKDEGTKARQIAFNERLAKAIEAVRKEDAAFREQARYAPNVLGDPRGTPEQQETFARARQKALETAVENLTKTVRPEARGAGVTVTKEQTDAIRALDLESKKYGDTIDALKEKERERAKAEREALAQTERAIGQRIQLEQLLTEAKAFGAREDQGAALAARARVEAQGEALRTRLEQGLEAIRKNPQIGGDYAQQLRDRLAALPGQVEAQAVDAYTRALEKQIEPLRRLTGLYGDTAEGASELAKAQKVAFDLIGTPVEEEALAHLDFLERLIQLQREAATSAPAGMKAVAEATRATTFEQGVADQLERLRLPREERLEDRLRAQARKQGVDLTPETEAQLKAITQQERFNQLMEISSRLGDTVAQNLTTGLLNVASGAERVGVAFRNMAKAILDSTAQLLVSEGFKLLIGFGLRALSGAVAGGFGTGAGAGASIGGGAGAYVTGVDAGAVVAARPLQHGGIVNRPTIGLIGENPAQNPEYILNRTQMSSLMNSARQAGPSAGGQAMGGASVTVINVADRAEGERRAAQERAMGKQVVLNYVMDELSQGSGSRIAQVLRAGQR